MAKFKDNLDREWEIRLDAPTILKIRAEFDSKFMLHDSREDNTYKRLHEDPVLLCSVIHFICQSQMKATNVTDDDFFENVIGNAIDRATEAMLEAILNFTPLRTRELLREVTARSADLEKQATTMALQKVKDPAFSTAILKAMEKSLDDQVREVLTPLRSVTG
jgi:hypothetical protein